jgi:hypothetical protein
VTSARPVALPEDEIGPEWGHELLHLSSRFQLLVKSSLTVLRRACQHGRWCQPAATCIARHILRVVRVLLDCKAYNTKTMAVRKTISIYTPRKPTRQAEVPGPVLPPSALLLNSCVDIRLSFVMPCVDRAIDRHVWKTAPFQPEPSLARPVTSMLSNEPALQANLTAYQ